MRTRKPSEIPVHRDTSLTRECDATRNLSHTRHPPRCKSTSHRLAPLILICARPHCDRAPDNAQARQCAIHTAHTCVLLCVSRPVGFVLYRYNTWACFYHSSVKKAGTAARRRRSGSVACGARDALCDVGVGWGVNLYRVVVPVVVVPRVVVAAVVVATVVAATLVLAAAAAVVLAAAAAVLVAVGGGVVTTCVGGGVVGDLVGV